MTATARFERALTFELLALLIAANKPVRIRDLFDGFEPQWAIAAAERCVVAGYCREWSGGELELLPAGRALAVPHPRR
jgi:hypothetical protein